MEKGGAAHPESRQAVTSPGDYRHARRGASWRHVARVLNTAYAHGLLAAEAATLTQQAPVTRG